MQCEKKFNSIIEELCKNEERMRQSREQVLIDTGKE